MGREKSDLHLKMYNKRKPGQLYGLEWGDPETDKPLKNVRDFFLLPHVSEDKNILEIGPGGGRWTRYMLKAREVIVVDPFEEILAGHEKAFPDEPIRRIQNTGTDFPGIEPHSIDFVFSFGVFVHLDADIIKSYLQNLSGILHADSRAFIQFADKSKPVAFTNRTFVATFPNQIRQMLHDAGFTILCEDTSSLRHSVSFLFRLKEDGDEFNPSGQLPPLPPKYYTIRH